MKPKSLGRIIGTCACGVEGKPEETRSIENRRKGRKQLQKLPFLCKGARVAQVMLTAHVYEPTQRHLL